jgi:hypothetical protein
LNASGTAKTMHIISAKTFRRMLEPSSSEDP